MEREHIFVGLFLISFFLLLPSVTSELIPPNSICGVDNLCASDEACQDGVCVSNTPPETTYCNMNSYCQTQSSNQEILDPTQPHDSFGDPVYSLCPLTPYIYCWDVRSAAQQAGHNHMQIPPGWGVQVPGYAPHSSSCVVHSSYQYTLQGCQNQGQLSCAPGSTPTTYNNFPPTDDGAYIQDSVPPVYVKCEPIQCPPGQELNHVGECLDVLAPTPPACGAAARSYAVTATQYITKPSGAIDWCTGGTPSNTPSAFLGVGGTTTWYCSNSHESVTCSASRDRCSDNRYWDGSSCVSGPAVSINVQVDGQARDGVYVDQNPNSILEGASYDQDLRGTTGDIEGGYLRTRASNEDVVNAHLRVPSVSGASFVGWNTVANNGWGCNYLTGGGNCGISVIVSEEASVVEEEEEVVVVSSRVLFEDVLVSEMGFSRQFLVYFVGDTVTFRVRSLDASYVVSSSFGSFSVPSSGELVEFSFVASEPGEVVFSLEGASQTKELLVVIS